MDEDIILNKFLETKGKSYWQQFCKSYYLQQ